MYLPPAPTRLLAAAGLSVAAHAMLLAGSWLMPPVPAPERPPLTARLEPLPPSAATPPPAPPRPHRIAALASPALIAPIAPIAPIEPMAPTVIPDAPLQTAAIPEPGTTPAPPVTVAAALPTTFAVPEIPPLPSFPRKGRITYLLTMGPEYTPIGRTVQTWEFEGKRYRLGSQSESTGLLELLRPHRYHYLSQGTLSDQGLRPERFLSSIQRGSRTEEALAVFDWNEGRAQLGRIPQQTTVALPAGSQDVISFMYQLALAPPAAGRIRLPFTRGSSLDTVSFDVLPEESIDTPLGRLRTVPVVQARITGHESLAVWLAADYRHLPVRIRFFNRDGVLSGEQLVSEIRVGDE